MHTTSYIIPGFMASINRATPRIASLRSTLLRHDCPPRVVATGISQPRASLSIDRRRRFHGGTKRAQLPPPAPRKLLMSASFFSFLGSLFSSSSTASADSKMSYPDQRSDEEWRAVLSPGLSHPSIDKGLQKSRHGVLTFVLT